MTPEHDEWLAFHNQRNFYFKILIISLFAVWFALSPVALYFNSDPLTDILVMNGAWFVFVAPYLFYKINETTKQLNQAKEDVVLRVYKNQSKNISKIAKITGLPDNFVEFYLKKNDIKAKNSVPIDFIKS